MEARDISHMSVANELIVREFRARDVPDAIKFWLSIEGLGLTESDNPTAIEAFLERNPGFSPIAMTRDGEVVGAALCGHNGRAAHHYHLAVSAPCRKQGIATLLLDYSYARLIEARIPRCNIFVYTANEAGNSFWRHSGWIDPSDWKVMQKRIGV